MSSYLISDSELKNLGERIRDKIFIPIHSFKKYIFLCGASLDKKNSVRSKIDHIFTRFLNNHYEIIYPEDIFEELLSGPSQENILTLENTLVNSVDAVILIPESPGSIAELGAFTNNEALREKVICIQNTKLKRKKSFINYGPIKLIKKSKKGKIVNIDYSKFKNRPVNNFIDALESEEVRKVRAAISTLKRNLPPTKIKKTLNLLNADQFILPCLFLLENIKRDVLEKLFQLSSNEGVSASKVAIAAAINILNKKKYILQTPVGIQLTKEGLNEFKSQGRRNKIRPTYSVNDLDELRLEILTWKNRKKTLFTSKIKAPSQSVL